MITIPLSRTRQTKTPHPAILIEIAGGTPSFVRVH